MRNNRLTFVRYLAFSIEIVLLAVLQSTPFLMPEVLGSKPVLLISAALSIAAMQEKIPALVFGAVCGAAADLSCGSVGFFAISLTLVCYFEAHLLSAWLRPSALTASLFSLAAVCAVLGVYFVLFRLIQSPADAGYLFLHHYVSRIVYTFVCVIPLYFFNGFLSRALRKAKV